MGWTQPPPAKKVKTTKFLKLKKVGAKSDVENFESEISRFVSPSKGLETYQQPFCPKKTAVSTRWALKNFEDWSASYNLRHPDSSCPAGILLVDDPKLLSFWLQKYIISIGRRQVKPPQRFTCYCVAFIAIGKRRKKCCSISSLLSTLLLSS